MGKQGIVKGLGVSSGYAIGRVLFYGATKKVSKEPAILVVSELSRSIVTSLPENVCAVVAEKGSVGCHGAGILREKGIPCVLRIERIFESLRENEIVEVIGDTGTIRIIDYLLKKQVKWRENVKIEEKEVCYRPNRIYQTLRFDIMKGGWERSPEYLFSLPRCNLRLENGIIFISNAPNLEDLRRVVVENPDDFLLISKKRELEIQRIKSELENIKININYNDIALVYEQFNKCIKLYHDLLKYIYITQFISDDLIEELVGMIENRGLGSEFREKYINERLISEYVTNSISKEKDPGVSTTWRIPCGEPYIWHGNINWKRDIGDRQLVAKMFAATEEEGFDFYARYSSLILVVPILYQLAEEHYFISSSICSFLNKFIEVLADILVTDGELKLKEEILEKQLEFVEEKFKEKAKEV